MVINMKVISLRMTKNNNGPASFYLSFSILQLGFFLLHPLHEHLPHLIFSPLQLQQKLLTLGLVSLLQTTNTHIQHTSKTNTS